MIARRLGLGRSEPLLVVVYVACVPFLLGLPRGAIFPLLRPSEVLQIVLTAIGLALVGARVFRGQRWRISLRPTEWWLLAVVVTASIVPLLWLAARGRPIGGDELLAALPFVKYGALYLLVRATVRTEREVTVVLHAIVSAAVAVAVIGLAQALGSDPVIDVLGRYFVSSTDDVVDGGRATTTIGSSIATGAYLAIACGVGLSYAYATDKRLWSGIAAALGLGALATGQAGSVVALGTIVLVVAGSHRRLRRLAGWALPLTALSLVALWPILAARLADIDQGSGLPTSWLIRWNNITELFWPQLAGGGWVLGVTPDAVVTPPEVWREVVYLESGYLWLLWVGGLPLLMAVCGFLISSWRDLDHTPRTATPSIRAVGLAARAAVVMMATLTVIDPHLTLRGGADLFFVIVPLAAATLPFAIADPLSHRRWRSLLVAGPEPACTRARLQVTEARDLPALDPVVSTMVESGIVVTVRTDDRHLGHARIALCRRGSALHGLVTERVEAVDAGAAALVWRGLVLCADSLRLESLRPASSVTGADPDASAFPARRELKAAARLARRLERERLATGETAARTTDGDGAGAGRPGKGSPPVGHRRRGGDGDDRDNPSPFPGVRLVLDVRVPRWKRAIDVGGGAIALIVSAPVWIACAAAVRRTSPGPILFRQVRVGAGGLPFQLYKFRTMHVDNDDSAHRRQNRRELLEGADGVKDADDDRITPAGRWLRRWSLDELPQVLNVLRSEMSLVGPRPSLLWEVELFEPAKRRRLDVRPGLTGLWQTQGRADVSMGEMLDLDLVYVDTMGPAVDLRCLIGTAASVVNGRGAR